MAQSGWPGYKSTAHLARLLGFSFSFALVSSLHRDWISSFQLARFASTFAFAFAFTFASASASAFAFAFASASASASAFAFAFAFAFGFAFAFTFAFAFNFHAPPVHTLQPFPSSCPNYLILLLCAIYFLLKIVAISSSIFIRWFVFYARSVLFTIMFASRFDVPILS